MPDDQVRQMFMTPFAHPQQALEAAFAELGTGSQALALPLAGSIIPSVS
jgi:hypothetical protein